MSMVREEWYAAVGRKRCGNREKVAKPPFPIGAWAVFPLEETRVFLYHEKLKGRI